MGWPQEIKDEALRLYVEHGPTIAAEMVGVPTSTVKDWSQKAGLANSADAGRWDRERKSRLGKLTAEENAAHQREHQEWKTAAVIREERKRMELQEKWLDTANELLDRLNRPAEDFKGKDATHVWYEVPDARSSVELVKAAAIAIDKYRLEKGEVTDRTESITLEGVNRWIEELEQLEASLSDNDPRDTADAGKAVPAS